MGFGFHRVHEIRKLDRILNEEHRHVVAHQVEVAFIGKEFDGKTAHITHGITRTPWALNGGKTHEHRGNFLRVLQEAGLGQGGMRFVGLEVTMGPGTAGMHDAFRDALVVKMRDLLTHDEVFKQRRATVASLEGVLVVGNLDPLIGAQGLAGGVTAKHLQALQLGVGIGPVGGLGTGELAFLGRVLLAGHQCALLTQSVLRFDPTVGPIQ
ncbi:hypothetical protein D3C85_1195810 [compost metagenome]